MWQTFQASLRRKAGANTRIELSQALERADVEPVAVIQAAAQATSRDGPNQQGKHREFAGRTAVKKLRVENSNSGVSEPLGLALHHEVAVEAEVTARDVRGI